MHRKVILSAFIRAIFEGGERQSGHYGTKPVGQYAPNAFGLYDVHGNVREWTQDAYAARLPGGRLTDPEPQVGRDSYAVRGGGWADRAVRVRSAAREDVGGGSKPLSGVTRLSSRPKR